jgi:hypothetical protein
MKFDASCCSRCSHYTPEGRRGGHCGQLGVPVKGKWKACSLAVPVFLTPLEELQPLEILPKPIEIRLPDTQLESVKRAALDDPSPLHLSLQ